MFQLCSYPSLQVDVEEVLKSLQGYAQKLRPMVRDTVLYVNTAVQEGKRVVVEGANAAMLDIDFGKGSMHEQVHWGEYTMPPPLCWCLDLPHGHRWGLVPEVAAHKRPLPLLTACSNLCRDLPLRHLIQLHCWRCVHWPGDSP